MRKEHWAAALLILMLCGAVINVRYIEKKTEEITGLLEISRDYYNTGYYEMAEECLDSAIETWLDSDGYTHIAIRHTQIDSATDALYELKNEIESHEKGTADGAYGKIIAQLVSIAGMEHVTVGSIF